MPAAAASDASDAFEWHRTDIQGTATLRFRVDVDQPSDCSIVAVAGTRFQTGALIFRLYGSLDGAPERFQIGAGSGHIAQAHAGPLNPRPLITRVSGLGAEDVFGSNLYGQSLIGYHPRVQASVTVSAFDLDPDSPDPHAITGGRTFGIDVDCDDAFRVVPLEGGRTGGTFSSATASGGVRGSLQGETVSACVRDAFTARIKESCGVFRAWIIASPVAVGSLHAQGPGAELQAVITDDAELAVDCLAGDWTVRYSWANAGASTPSGFVTGLEGLSSFDDLP